MRSASWARSGSAARVLDEGGHLERLLVVREHHLDELDVGVGPGGVLDRLGLVRRQRRVPSSPGRRAAPPGGVVLRGRVVGGARHGTEHEGQPHAATGHRRVRCTGRARCRSCWPCGSCPSLVLLVRVPMHELVRRGVAAHVHPSLRWSDIVGRSRERGTPGPSTSADLDPEVTHMSRPSPSEQVRRCALRGWRSWPPRSCRRWRTPRIRSERPTRRSRTRLLPVVRGEQQHRPARQRPARRALRRTSGQLRVRELRPRVHRRPPRSWATSTASSSTTSPTRPTPP